MTPPNTDQLDTLFPNRLAEAERLGIHPDLRAYFVPLAAGGFTDEQSDVLFPGWRGAMKSITETLADGAVRPAETDEAQAS